MNQRKIGGLLVLVVGIIIGTMTIAQYVGRQPAVSGVPDVVAQTDKNNKKESEVAGVSTTQAASPPPAARAVITPDAGARSVTVTAAPHPQRPPRPQLPTPVLPPVVPDPPTPTPTPDTPLSPQEPETIEINIKGPVRYTLPAGQRSPTLSYKILDPVQYQWKPGLATIWQDGKRNPIYPVWATMLVDRSEAPYVSDEVRFVIEADPNTVPGTYEVKFILVIREGIELGIPVVVTVPPPGADSQPSAPQDSTTTVRQEIESSQ